MAKLKNIFIHTEENEPETEVTYFICIKVLAFNASGGISTALSAQCGSPPSGQLPRPRDQTFPRRNLHFPRQDCRQKGVDQERCSSVYHAGGTPNYDQIFGPGELLLTMCH